VIPRAGARLTLAEVVDFLKDRIATYKLPEALELFEDFPFTPTGKIQRHVLTHQVLERRETLVGSVRGVGMGTIRPDASRRESV
jgi:acyl-CoA synthetase (AMP-forming)/AMP-acid ligase II